MKVGFTGTRKGMSESQKLAFVLAVQDLPITEFHHGDCCGADEDAHYIIKEFFPNVKIVIHPPISDYLRAFCEGDEYKEPADYLKRDRAIVDSTEYLIGAPLTPTPAPRSGTWYTINYATKLDRPHNIIFR